METNALLGDSKHPNKITIKREGTIHVRFSRKYPEALRGVMTEDEYVGYLERIDEEGYYSKKGKPPGVRIPRRACCGPFDILLHDEHHRARSWCVFVGFLRPLYWPM